MNKSQSAGIFSTWLQETREMLGKETGADVPCGKCIGCCSSSQFIHIRPDERQTLSRIPKKFLFKAPLLPKGTMVLGYDDQGRCPMLAQGKCSIYKHRPQTCRMYDCRVFSAAGIVADDDVKGLINMQVKRWRFKYPHKQDKILHSAVKAAARFIRTHTSLFPGGQAPTQAAQIAVLAIKGYDAFHKRREPIGKPRPQSP
jgi:uncharacterized protein